MKNIIAAIFLCLIGTNAHTQTLAQTTPESTTPRLQPIQVGILCGDLDFIRTGLEEIGQIVFISGKETEQNKTPFDFTAITLNPETDEFTFLLISSENRLACILHQGTNFKIMP